MHIYRDIEQRSPEWHQLRTGKITGTRMVTMVTGKPATVETLCRKVASEIITGVSAEKPFKTTDAMQRGIELESTARLEYELSEGCVVEEVGFVEGPESPGLFGVSPDGLIGDDGGFEAKCPMVQTQLGYLYGIKMGVQAWADYRWQIQGSLWVSGRDYWDFVSYCPDYLDESQALIVERVEPIKADQERIQAAAEKCEARINEILEAVR